APTRLSGTSISFPKTTSAVWHVTFGYVQPLRISEMNFNELSAGQTISRGLRFLAQPEQSYQIYFDADRYVQSTRKEAGDLFTDKGVVTFSGSNQILNPEYAPVDSDGDSVPDLTDNCTSIANTDQKDSDGNGLGDACEDYDRDGIVNAKDDCQDIPNVAQEDTDDDGIGDVCDTYENRVTERLPWLPWMGIGLAGVVLLGLFVLAIKHKDAMPPPASPTA
ncbi:MAG: thrombospondin type 3 repeat-containing protein, partial [bacterium]|nr:thrombospondin type 3 repeat-containing protein [bacterium]